MRESGKKVGVFMDGVCGWCEVRESTLEFTAVQLGLQHCVINDSLLILLRSRPPLSLSPWIHVVQLKSSSLILFPFIFKNQLPPPIGIHVHST
jgi:hypothetical protein